MAALCNALVLMLERGAAVNNADLQIRIVAKLPRFTEDLNSQLPSWGYNHCLRLSNFDILGIIQQFGEDRQQKSSSFTRASLGTSHQITTSGNHWD